MYLLPGYGGSLGGCHLIDIFSTCAKKLTSTMLKSSAKKNNRAYKFTGVQSTMAASSAKDDPEKNEQSSDVRGGGDLAFGVFNIILWIITFVALVASLRRNRGLDWSILVAFFFSPFYLPYCIAVPYKGRRIWSMPI